MAYQILLLLSPILVPSFKHNVQFPKAWRSLSDADRITLSEYWPIKRSGKSIKGSNSLARPNPVLDRAFCQPGEQHPPGHEGANGIQFQRWLKRQELENISSGWELGLMRFEMLDPTEIVQIERPVGEVLKRVPVEVQKTTSVTFDFRFKNEEILASVKAWLKQNRPKSIPGADDRGKNLNHYRVALRRLGLMRQIWAKERKPNAAENKEARRTLQHFGELTASTELPIHWPAGWE